MSIVPKRWKKSGVPAQAPQAVSSLQAQINRLFEDFWGGGSLTQFPEPFRAGFTPNIETTEKNGTIEVSAELPGMTADDIKLTLGEDSDVLMLTGEKRFEEEKKEKDFHHAERAYGSFTRSIPLPGRVDPEKIAADFKDGVLKVTLTRAGDSPGTRNIPVR